MKSKSYPKVCAAIMAKNEEERILDTLKSTFGVVHEVFFYDTGSTDHTLQLVREWGQDNNIPIHVKEDVWINNFSHHRNILLQWIDDEFQGDFVLMLDANDEIKNQFALRNWLKSEFTKDLKETTSYTVHQQWKQVNIIDYYNVRVIKPRSGWRYQRRVHEVLVNNNGDGSVYSSYEHGKVDPEVIWYQDRTHDQHKTQKRLESDLELLLQDLEDYPNDVRSLYYLAQTYFAKYDYVNAYKYYKLRIENSGKFVEEQNKEEVFHSYFNLGQIAIRTEKPFHKIAGWLNSAYKYWNRAEPLTYLANHCMKINENNLGFMYASLACEAGYPANALQIVDTNIYTHQRFLIKAILGARLNYFDDAYQAICVAHDNCPDDEYITGIYDAIERKMVQREEELKKQQEELMKNVKGKTLKLVNTNDTKEEWIDKWKKAYLLKNKDVDPKVLDKMATSAYNKIFG